MVTLAQIEDVHGRLGRPDTLGDYVRALADLDVTSYDSYLADGRTEFRSADGSTLVWGPHHDLVAVAAVADHAAIHRALAQAEAGELDYETMSTALADAGLERWSVDVAALTMAYVDIAGQDVLVEQLS